MGSYRIRMVSNAMVVTYVRGRREGSEKRQSPRHTGKVI